MDKKKLLIGAAGLAAASSCQADIESFGEVFQEQIPMRYESRILEKLDGEATMSQERSLDQAFDEEEWDKVIWGKSF